MMEAVTRQIQRAHGSEPDTSQYEGMTRLTGITSGAQLSEAIERMRRERGA